MGLLPSYYVRLALPWAWLAVGSGLDSVANFFFFFIYFISNFFLGFFFFFGLESRTNNFFFFNSRVLLIWIKYNFFFKKKIFRSGSSWEHPGLYLAPPLFPTPERSRLARKFS